MGSRDFERATPNRIAGGTTAYGTELTACTFAVICTVETIPGPASYHTTHELDGVSARQMCMAINGDASGNWYAERPGGTVSNSGIVPPTGTDTEWLMACWAAAAGTVAADFWQYRYSTGAWSTATGGNLGSHTAAVTTANIGSFGTGDYWDGRLFMAGIWNRKLTDPEVRSLIYPRNWLGLHRDGRGLHSVLGDPRGRMGLDFFNPRINFTGGTDPGVTPVHPPGL